MSRIVRKQLFEILNTLQSANDMLEGLFADASNSAMIDLLADCQNCAITMGNKIEAVYGEGTASVKALENYCESIYLVSQNLEQPDVCQEHYANSKEHLKAVATCMEQEIPDKKEIVFMPYKASMWDSLESVYLAAREDETCEAYVVPIPYYDRKQDKSLGEMHCDGGEYPKDISITDWEQYNFEERCPDVIYIHNAYDDMNLVTCVHPRFFSSNLKKYTGELIYIPYFVLEEIEPDDKVKIEGMKHFCVLPGIINAHKVILQSEKMSQIYINEYAKAFEAAGAVVDREQLKQKFLGLGSPKFDKVVNTKKEDVEVPDEWLNIIQKPDGTWKKIVFYNTTVTALLNHDEKMLIKMKNVFEIFKERQDEVALLWRPHPLIKTTIEAMQPQLWADYAKLVEQYKAEGWGIYDDTADMDRAIALSDAYYGDQSSIVQLCQKAGMPVMVQDVFIICEEASNHKVNHQVRVETSDVICDVDKIWFCADNFNGIFSIDLKTRNSEFHGGFPQNIYHGKRTYIILKKVGDKIYFLPFNGEDIIAFDTRHNSFEQIKLDEEKIGGKLGHALFAGVVQCEKYLFALPKHSKAIVRLDLESNEVEYIAGWAEQIDNSVNNDNGYFRKQFVLMGNRLFLPFYNVNAILELDCSTMEFRFHRLSVGNGYSGICCSGGDDLWLSCNTGELLNWIPGMGIVKQINLEWNEENIFPHACAGVLYFKDKLHVFPRVEFGIDKLHKETDIFVAEGQYSIIKEDDDNWMSYRYDSRVITIINKKSWQKEEVEIAVNGENLVGLIFEENANVFSESLEINICQFLLKLCK